MITGVDGFVHLLRFPQGPVSEESTLHTSSAFAGALV